MKRVKFNKQPVPSAKRWLAKAKRGNITTTQPEYTDEEREFMLGMDRKKRETGTPHPDSATVLRWAREMGWRKL